MDIKIIDIEKLSPRKDNIRNHGEKQITELKKSINAFGQIRPIVTDEKGFIIAGHALWETLKFMGETKAKVLMLEGLSETEKRKLMLADNKIFELGSTDHEAILEVLEEIKSDGGDLDIPGYDMEVLNSLIAETDEIDLQLNSYGDISEEKREQLSEQRKETMSQQIEQGEREVVLNNDIIEVEQRGPTERPRPYVECPKCSEKIWL